MLVNINGVETEMTSYRTNVGGVIMDVPEGYINKGGVLYPWATTKAIETIPSQSNSLSYTGSSQSPTWNNYDSDALTIGGTTSATDAGTYTATFTPNKGYCWSDGSTTSKDVTWSIDKINGIIRINRTSYTFSSSSTSFTITVTKTGDGSIYAYSSKTSVATVSVSGNTVTVTKGSSSGSANIFVRMNEGFNYYGTGYQSCSVIVLPSKKALNDTTWEEISIVSAAGQGANYWSVGDCKAVAIKGTIGTQYVNATYYVYIIGFNHKAAANKIDFGTFKTALSGGKDVCLIDGNYLGNYTNGTKYFNINHSSQTNVGGWKSCDLRYDILGSTRAKGGNAATNTATSPVSNTLMAALPSDLRAVMKPMTIYTDNKGGSSNTASNVSSTVDYLPLMGEIEVFGTRSHANSVEKNYQQQYTYFSSGNSKIKYRHSATGSTAYWWLRSPSYHVSGSNSYFCVVSTGGTIASGTADKSMGIAPIFRV